MTSSPHGQDRPDDGDVDLVDLDLHCAPDREHCVRLEDVHLDAVHLGDESA